MARLPLEVMDVLKQRNDNWEEIFSGHVGLERKAEGVTWVAWGDGLNLFILETEKLVQRRLSMWADWVSDPWYGNYVYYKIVGNVQGGANDNAARRTKSGAVKYVLVEDGGSAKFLGYWERDGRPARCARVGEIGDIMQRFYDCHGHFSGDLMWRLLIGRWYWPRRFSDVVEWCRSCLSCQKLGPLRPSTDLLPILQMQLLDMIGLDFLRLFNPMGHVFDSENPVKYILVMVDHFSKFLWAC